MEDLTAESGHFRSGGVRVFAGKQLVHMAPSASMVPKLIHDLVKRNKGYIARARSTRASRNGDDRQMKLLILCDQQSRDYNDMNLGEAVTEVARATGWDVKKLPIDFDDIHFCTGCFGCWIKTPGLCVIKNDNANVIAHDFMNNDAVLLLSRITYGGFSADIKAILDRMIPNALPFFQMLEGEMHHPQRYKKIPHWIAFGFGSVTDEEADTFTELTKRNALNFHPPRYLTLIARGEAELPRALSDLQTFLKKEGAI